MRKLALIALAASAAAMPVAATAQPAPQSGHSWGRGGGPRDGVRHMPRHDGGQRVVVRNGDGGQRIVVRQRNNGNQRIVVRDGGQRIVVRNGGGGFHGGNRFPHITRIIRGHRVPHFWFGPQFHVRNWQMYGFGQPVHDRRWIRYYDDALLIDRGGMVHDGRYGVDWDQYEDAWRYDDRGIPVYVGEGDYRPGGEDYAWAEEEAAGWDTREYGESRDGYHEETRYGHGGGAGYAPVVPPPGVAYGGYGHGGYGAYGYGGAATITETITETFVQAPATGYVEEVVEEVVETRRPRRVRRAPRPRCDCAPVRRHRPAAPPPSGERG